MVLDRAVGTSFTLDLEAMLLAPLAFALFDTDQAASDPTALLAAIQQNAENIALYCDRAHIYSKPSEQKLFVLLEPSLLPVAAPNGGSFHPKLWALRFRDADGDVRHRVLVLSRNLTFDTSWDLVARLDEQPRWSDGRQRRRSGPTWTRQAGAISDRQVRCRLSGGRAIRNPGAIQRWTALRDWVAGFKSR